MGTHGFIRRMNALDNVEVHPASQTTALSRTDEPSIHDVIEPLARMKRDSELVSPTSPITQGLVEPDGIEPTT